MIDKIVLPNGLRVIAEELPYLRSVTIGIWILAGSASEDNSINGISHFLEHMLFKGTNKRTAKEIAEELDSVGGQLEAFTGREFTCYSAKVLDNHLPLALDVLHDMFANSIFPSEEIVKEKGVVHEEIFMHEDSPQEQVHDLFASAIWKGHPLSLSILGTEENINKFTREDLINYSNKQYCGSNVVITAAGNLKVSQFFKDIENLFNTIPKGNIIPDNTSPAAHSSIIIKKKKLEQIHFCLGTSGLDFTNPKRYHLYLFNSLLGGSMSSRLFQSVREKHGLVYNIYSYQSSYRNGGIFSVYAGTKESNFEKVLKIIADEFNKLKNEHIPDKELMNTKEQLKGGITLNTESTESRMGHLAKSEIYFQHQTTIDEIFQNIDAVKKEDILNIAQELLQPKKFTISMIGDVNNKIKEKISKILM